VPGEEIPNKGGDAIGGEEMAGRSKRRSLCTRDNLQRTVKRRGCHAHSQVNKYSAVYPQLQLRPLPTAAPVPIVKPTATALSSLSTRARSRLSLLCYIAAADPAECIYIVNNLNIRTESRNSRQIDICDALEYECRMWGMHRSLSLQQPLGACRSLSASRFTPLRT
jgi:hypothetical protein